MRPRQDHLPLRKAVLVAALAATLGAASLSACTRPTGTPPVGGTVEVTESIAGTPKAGETPGTAPGLGPAGGATTAPVSFSLPAYETIELENGARVLLIEKHDVPLVAFTALLGGGALTDPPDKAGTAAVLAEAMLKGAGDRSAQAFAETIDDAGGSLAAYAGREFIQVDGEFLAEDADLMIELLADALRRPTLSDAEIQKVRDRGIEFVAAEKDANLGGLISTYADAFLFGDHPYSRPVDGSGTSLERITAGDVQDAYATEFGADRLILVVVGDFEAAEMRERIEAALGDWAPAADPAPAAPAALPSHPGRQVLLVDNPGAAQTYFWLGNVGVSRGDPDTPAIDLANTVFGGRFTSILNNALRVESGLTYGASSLLARHTSPGTVSIESDAETENTAEAVDMAIDLLAKYRAEGMDAATLDSAKAYTLGQFPLDLETGDDLASRLARNAFYGLGDDALNDYGDQIAAVSTDQVKAAIDRVFPAPENLTIVLIGDAEELRSVAERYGPVTEMSIDDPDYGPPSR